MNKIGIGFWKKQTGNLMNIGKGLSPTEIEFLQSLKPGDRLILWENNNKDEKQPTHTMRKYEKNPL